MDALLCLMLMWSVIIFFWVGFSGSSDLSPSYLFANKIRLFILCCIIVCNHFKSCTNIPSGSISLAFSLPFLLFSDSLLLIPLLHSPLPSPLIPSSFHLSSFLSPFTIPSAFSPLKILLSFLLPSIVHVLSHSLSLILHLPVFSPLSFHGHDN